MRFLPPLLLFFATPAAAQVFEGPPAYQEAMARLRAGDTLGAMMQLRDASRTAPDFGPAFLRLGSLLSARAGERERDFEERVEAEKMLERALTLLGDDPEVLLELGLLFRKQQIRVDAKRVLERAWAAAERKGKALSPEQRARLHFELGRTYEAWWEDWQNLHSIPPAAQGTMHCAALSAALPAAAADELQRITHPDASVLCPEQWADQLQGLIPLADHKSEERERMLAHFRLALEADPAHVDAAGALLGHLADLGEWQEYERVARRLLLVLPQDGRAQLFLGLGLHELRRDAEADSAFRRALALLPPAERRIFEDIAPVLPKATRAKYVALDSAGRAETTRRWLAATDPLYLTDAEERRLEHYTRLAWAELKFSAPASGLRGWDSDRGRIWVRYGPPWRWYQCCYGGGGRTIYWSYGRQGPVFVFGKQLAYRRARLTEVAQVAAEHLDERAPELYRPRAITALHDLPHQVARFRGGGPGLTRLEIYASPPIDSLGVPSGGQLEAGVFLFDHDYSPVWQRKHQASYSGMEIGLTYRVDLPAGEYRYGVEARAVAADTVARAAGRARGTLSVPGFPPGRLALSDLLLAQGIRARPQATRREELLIVPNRTLRVPAGNAIHLYFEVYGLAPGEGLGRYTAELAVEDSTRRNVVERIARGVEELFRRAAPEARVSWERTAPIRDDVVIDYLAVELPALSPGEYVVRLKVTDRASGQTADAVRRFRIEPPEGSD